MSDNFNPHVRLSSFELEQFELVRLVRELRERIERAELRAEEQEAEIIELRGRVRDLSNRSEPATVHYHTHITPVPEFRSGEVRIDSA